MHLTDSWSFEELNFEYLKSKKELKTEKGEILKVWDEETEMN